MLLLLWLPNWLWIVMVVMVVVLVVVTVMAVVVVGPNHRTCAHVPGRPG